MTKKVRKARGIKRSSMLKFQRQLMLIRCLGYKPARADDLIRQVNTLLTEAYPSAAMAAFRHDLKMLRDEFHCVIPYKPSVGYELEDLGDLAVLALSPDEMHGLRYLDMNYKFGSTIPDHAQVRTLLDHIISLLPFDNRGLLNEGEPMTGQLGPKITYEHNQRVVRLLQRALIKRRELTFVYTPGMRPGEEKHVVLPKNIFTRDGHLYLLGYCAKGPDSMAERHDRYVDYRVDYILPDSVELLPNVLPKSLPPRKIWKIKYYLEPDVARNRHVAHWFEHTHIDYAPDGSAMVSAEVANLWQACQILLRYMGACRVIEPPELVDLVRDAAQNILKQYQD